MAAREQTGDGQFYSFGFANDNLANLAGERGNLFLGVETNFRIAFIREQGGMHRAPDK